MRRLELLTKSSLSTARRIGAGGIHCRRKAPERACLYKPRPCGVCHQSQMAMRRLGLLAKSSLSTARRLFLPFFARKISHREFARAALGSPGHSLWTESFLPVDKPFVITPVYMP